MFASIKVKNFFSWESLEFDFKSGVTLIVGKNLDDNTMEGVGKSACINSLCWALFGQLPKDVNIDDVIKTGKSSCVVEVHLTDGTYIVRSRGPNQLYIGHHGSESKEVGKDMKETQKKINDLIGMSFDTFMQSVYFAQNYNNKFITANQEQKAKILSELQDLSIFDKAYKKANDMLRSVKMDLDIARNKLDSEKAIHKILNTQLIDYNNLNSNFELTKKEQLADFNVRIAELLSKNHLIETEMKEICNISSIEDKINRLGDANICIVHIQQQLYHIEQLRTSSSDGKCHSCGQTVSHASIKIQDDTDLRQKEEFLKEEISNLGIEIKDLTDKKMKNSILLEKLHSAHEQLSRLKLEVNKLEISINPYEDKINDYLKQTSVGACAISKLEDEITVNIKKVNYLEFLKPGYKEIKSYVFQSLLNELNTKTNKYLRDLFDIPAYITFDNVSNEGEISKIQTTVLLDGYERSLGLLSGGQFRRVQLAVDFALSDIVSQRSKSPINIRILDESFKDLSEPSMYKIIDILQKMKGSTILIEHNSLIKSIVTNVFEVQLEKGTSSVIK